MRRGVRSFTATRLSRDRSSRIARCSTTWWRRGSRSSPGCSSVRLGSTRSASPSASATDLSAPSRWACRPASSGRPSATRSCGAWRSGPGRSASPSRSGSAPGACSSATSRRIARRVERLAARRRPGRARARRRHGTARRAHAGPRRAHPGHRGAGGRLGPGRGRAAPERGGPPLGGRHHRVRQRDRRAALCSFPRGSLPRRNPAFRTSAGPAGRGPSRPEGFTHP